MAEDIDRGESLERLLEERILILDGAMGTRIQRFGLSEAHYRGAEFRSHPRPLTGSYDLLSITQPALVASIHREYFDAGADIITTNTFRANLPTMAGYGLADTVYALNLAAARLASTVRNTTEKARPHWPRFVAGSVSVTDAPAEAYSEQVRGLLDGGVDILMLETVFDANGATAALDAFDLSFKASGRQVPVMVSLTLTGTGRLPSGETVEQVWNSVADRRLLAVGINCSVGGRMLEPHIEWLSAAATPFLSCHPNGGLPGPGGQYPDTPETLASVLEEFAGHGWLNIAGGCCGTGPEHTRRIRARVASSPPRLP